MPPQKKNRLIVDPTSDMDEATNIQGKIQFQKQGSISITGEKSVAKKVGEQSKDEEKELKARTDGEEPVVAKLRGISKCGNEYGRSRCDAVEQVGRKFRVISNDKKNEGESKSDGDKLLSQNFGELCRNEKDNAESVYDVDELMKMMQDEYQMVGKKLITKIKEVRSNEEPLAKYQHYEVTTDGKELPSKMIIINEVGDMITTITEKAATSHEEELDKIIDAADVKELEAHFTIKTKVNEYSNVMTEDISFSELTEQKGDSSKTSLSKETLSSESGPSTTSHKISSKVRKNVILHHSTPKSSSAILTKTQMVRVDDISAMLPTSDCHFF